MWSLVLAIGLEGSGELGDLVLSILLMLFIFGSIAALGRLFDRLMAY